MMARVRTNVPEVVQTAPPLDLASLVETTRISKPATGGSRFADNPFVPVLRDSFDADTRGDNGWRENTMPGFHVFDFTAALRHATTVLAEDGVGVRIRYSFVDDTGKTVEQGNLRDTKDGKAGVPEDERDVTVKYLGRPRKQYSNSGSDVDGDDTESDENESYSDENGSESDDAYSEDSYSDGE